MNTAPSVALNPENILPATPPTPPQTPQPSLVEKSAPIATSKPKKSLPIRSSNTTPFGVSLLKFFAFIIFLVCFGSWILLIAFTDPSNKYLKLFDIADNTATEFRAKKYRIQSLTEEKALLEGKISRLDYKLANKDYYHNTTQIRYISDNRLSVFHEFNDDGLQASGIISTIYDLEGYFNDANFSRYNRSLLALGKGNKLTVKNILLNRDSVSFTVEASNIFGKAFLLSTEFSNLINSLPRFKQSKIKHFVKKNDHTGAAVMGFSLSVKLQNPDEEDLDDKYYGFNDFQSFIANRYPSKK